jgi:hypothetical protein
MSRLNSSRTTSPKPPPTCRFWTSASALLCVIAILSCSDPVDANANLVPSECTDTRPEALGTGAPISFRADVMPVFEKACAFTSCHGSAQAANGIFLGKSDPDGVFSRMVEQRSIRYPEQTFVVPGDPTKSFLVKKLEPKSCNRDCQAGACGEPMPKSNPALAAESRLKVARWIAQGAKND